MVTTFVPSFDGGEITLSGRDERPKTGLIKNRCVDCDYWCKDDDIFYGMCLKYHVTLPADEWCIDFVKRDVYNERQR